MGKTNASKFIKTLMTGSQNTFLINSVDTFGIDSTGFEAWCRSSCASRTPLLNTEDAAFLFDTKKNSINVQLCACHEQIHNLTSIFFYYLSMYVHDEKCNTLLVDL